MLLASEFGATARLDLVAGLAAVLAEAVGARFLAMLEGANSAHRAMQAASPQDSALVRRAIVDGGRAGFAPVLAVIRSSGALEYARAPARREAELAARAIAGLPASAFRDSLLELASFSVTRRA